MARFPVPTTRLARFVSCGAVFAASVACAPTYQLETPPSFRRYENTAEHKLISADGVMLKIREVENYPKAELAFWVDAMRSHRVGGGYAIKSEDCFTTRQGLPGCSLEFMLPYGPEDWVLNETVYVLDDTIYLVEAAAPFERYAKVEKEIQASLRTFAPGG